MKKLLCAMALLVFVACVYGADLPVNKDYENYLIKSQFSLTNELTNMGYVPSPLVGVNIYNNVSEELPTTFDLRDVGGKSYVKSVRSQDPLEYPLVGWAFATMASVESNNLMNYGESPYFSPLNLINRNPLSSYFTMDTKGGNAWLAMGYFQNLTGPVDEKDDPYKSPYESPEVQPAAAGYVENMSFISNDDIKGLDADEIAVVKEKVMNKGAVYIRQADPKAYFDSSYTYCYCDAENPTPAHGVVIIGWDDEFDKTKFAKEPEENGAFLVQNSFGTILHDKGYYWISYYDTSICEAVSYDFISKEDCYYNDTMTYNTLPMQTGLDYRYAKIMYKAKTSGEITGIRPFFVYGGLKNNFKIYVNDNLEYDRNISSDYYGYKSEKIDNSIYYNTGDIITVVCEYNAAQLGGYNNALPIEKEIVISSTDVFEPTLTRNTNFYSADGEEFFDMYDMSCNVAFSLLVARRDITITLDPETLEMHPRDVATITPTVTGTDDKEVVWDTTDKKIASVDDKGVVTAKTAGIATISATTVDGKVTAVCEVTVTNVKAESLTLNKNTLQIDTGSTETLTATVLPKNTTFNEVTWSSSDTSIAKVVDGKVKGIKEGKCTIIASIPDGLIAECKVTVIDVPVAAIILNKTEAIIDTSSSIKLIATVLPKNATDKTIKWTSSNSKIATVSSKGVVKGVYPGKVTITATTSNGMYAECNVTVKNIPVKSISLNKDAIQIETRSTYKLKVIFNPSNASYKDIKWTSSNTKVATVNSNGTVSSKSIAGEATITAKSKNGKTATCVVTVVTVPVEDVKLSDSVINLNLTNKKTYQLTATVIPENATVQSVTWTSSNKKVATVTSKGKVTAIGYGSCIVTVKTKDGGYVKTCRVNVKSIPVTSVLLDKSIVSMSVGDKYQLNATVKPENASNKKVTWTSTNIDVVKVDKNGLVKAVGVGKADVKVVSQDTGVSDTCKFVVK